MNKQPELTARTRQNFVDAYCKLCIGGTPVSVKELTKAAGYNRCTFYQYFSDLDGVLDYIADDLLGEMADVFQKSIFSQDFSDSILDGILEIYSRKETYLRVMLHPSYKSRFVEKAKARMAPMLIQTLAGGRKDIHSKYVLDVFFAGVLAALSRWILCQEEISRQQLSGIARSLFINWLIPTLQEPSKL